MTLLSRVSNNFFQPLSSTNIFMNFNEKTPRRVFFKKSIRDTVAISAGISMAATLLPSFTADAMEVTMMDTPTAATDKEFRMKVFGPATLSLMTSEIAVGKSTQKNAKEFAGFELAEAKAVTAVLKDLATPMPQMDAKAKATLEKIKMAKQGPEFDKAYIQAQYENHVFLRDLAANYIKNAAGKTDPAESQGRHLATLAHATFSEHVMITKRILGELGA
jgi:predicted outer membrane protein